MGYYDFVTLDTGETICIKVHIMEPTSEINAWINALNEAGLWMSLFGGTMKQVLNTK